jgi:hypothetical protein
MERAVVREQKALPKLRHRRLLVQIFLVLWRVRLVETAATVTAYQEAGRGLLEVMVSAR